MASKPSESSSFTCKICVDEKPCNKRFGINYCNHSYCSDCVVQYITPKIHSNFTRIPCPNSGCYGRFEPQNCSSILDPIMLEKWSETISDAAVPASLKLYCPFNDCSARLRLDCTNIVETECPHCSRLICARCKVPWHSGKKCTEFRKCRREPKEDILLDKLAKNQKWARCSNCMFYVEKSLGCSYMTCRCGYTFCYDCGAPSKDHICSKCKPLNHVERSSIKFKFKRLLKRVFVKFW